MDRLGYDVGPDFIPRTIDYYLTAHVPRFDPEPGGAQLGAGPIGPGALVGVLRRRPLQRPGRHPGRHHRRRRAPGRHGRHRGPAPTRATWASRSVTMPSGSSAPPGRAAQPDPQHPLPPPMDEPVGGRWSVHRGRVGLGRGDRPDRAGREGASSSNRASDDSWPSETAPSRSCSTPWAHHPAERGRATLRASGLRASGAGRPSGELGSNGPTAFASVPGQWTSSDRRSPGGRNDGALLDR